MSESTRDRLVRDLVETKQPKASDTPRTDALLAELHRIGVGAKDYRIDLESLARELERELTVCRAVTSLCCEKNNKPKWRNVEEDGGGTPHAIHVTRTELGREQPLTFWTMHQGEFYECRVYLPPVESTP